MIEESKELMQRKNNELLRNLQDKERTFNEYESDRADELHKMRQDNSDLQQQINHQNFLISKLKSELSEKDNQFGRNINDNDHELEVLRQNLEMKKQENAQLSAAARDLRQTLK